MKVVLKSIIFQSHDILQKSCIPKIATNYERWQLEIVVQFSNSKFDPSFYHAINICVYSKILTLKGNFLSCIFNPLQNWVNWMNDKSPASCFNHLFFTQCIQMWIKATKLRTIKNAWLFLSASIRNYSVRNATIKSSSLSLVLIRGCIRSIVQQHFSTLCCFGEKDWPNG